MTDASANGARPKGRPPRAPLTLPVGRRLKALREYQQRPQAELERACGVAHSTYSSWETGKTYPTLPQLVVLARELATTTDVLLGLQPLVLSE